MRGYRNKILRRKREGQGFYRPAKKTLAKRVKKKLMDKTNWYKKTKSVEDQVTGCEKPDMRSFGQRSTMNKARKKRQGGHVLDRVEEERETATNKKSLVKAVIFVPQTEHSRLAKTLRENEEEMLKVERAGKSLTSMLTRTNPGGKWGGE